MSQIKTKFVENSAVTSDKLATDSVTTVKILDANVTNAKLATGIDAAKLANGSVSNAEFQYLDGVTSAIQTQLDAKLDDSQLGAANGVASLDAGGKLPVSQLPTSAMEYKGTFDPTGPTPNLANGTGDSGDMYYVSVAGSHDFGAGSISFGIGDMVLYNGSIYQKLDNTESVQSVNGETGVVVLDTGDISENGNLYFTDERAQDAIGTILVDSSSIDFTYADGTPSITAVVLPAGVDHDSLQNFVANEHIDHSTVSIATASDSGLSGGGNITATRSLVIDPNNAPSETVASGDYLLIADVSAANALKKVTAGSIAALAAGAAFGKETFVLSAGDITNQYVDFAQVAKTGSVVVSIKGSGSIIEGASYDYSLSYTGGAGGKTRLTFLNDLATGGNSALVATDVLQVSYGY